MINLKSLLLHPRLPHYHITRTQLLITTLISFIGTFLYLVPDYPFHKGFIVCAFSSGLIHLALFMFFNQIFPLIPITLIFLSAINTALLAFVVHYSGGIVSPFNFLFVSILISDAIYGVDYPYAMFFSIAAYTSVVLLEYGGVIAPLNLSANQIYKSGFFTAFTGGVTVIFMVFSGYGIKQILRNLRNAVEEEHGKKLMLQKQLVSLEAPSQIGILVNKIVHDLRGPLGAISGFIEMMKKENKLTPESDEDCVVMLAELDRISNMLNRLIKYAKPNQFQKTKLCPIDLIETVLSVISFSPGAKRIRFERHFPASGFLSINAIKEEMQQVIFNILKNSIEALARNEKPPMIKCLVYRHLGDVYIEISDNGSGISPEIMHGLFNESISTKAEGAGLGLSIAKEIVESHDGELKIMSRQGEGTRTLIRMPLYSNLIQKSTTGDETKKTYA